MKLKLTWLLLVIILLFTGCAANRQSPTPNEVKASEEAPQAEAVKLSSTSRAQQGLADYLGLKLGRRWQYLGEGNEFASFTAEVTHVKGNLYQIEENNGGTHLARVIALQSDGAYEVLVQGEHPPGKSLLEEVLAGTDRCISYKKILPWPLQRGTAWTQSINTEVRLVSTGRSRSVPFGRVRQVIQTQTNTRHQVPVNNAPRPGAGLTTPQARQPQQSQIETSVIDSFYAKGIGLIERRFVSGDTVVTSKLQKMTLIQ